MNDTSKLYDIIWDAIESLGEFSYPELIGILETIKAEVMDEYLGLINEVRDDDASV
jgi:hypothetical protein